MRVCVIQMSSVNDKAANLDQARRLVEQAVRDDRPDLVLLPEVWAFQGGTPEERRAAAETIPGGEAYTLLQELAAEHGVFLHGGSFLERGHGDLLFNTSVAFDREGGELARYRKIHLFDITTPDGTGYRESAAYGAGTEIVTVQAAGVTLGLSICYDLRFPELYLELRRRGAELVFVPSNFTLATGKDHWEVLLRARAIETQCWFAAAASWGEYLDRGNRRQVYGHSLVCDPWGHVVARASDGVGWATARIDPALTARVRQGIPVLEHRRLA